MDTKRKTESEIETIRKKLKSIILSQTEGFTIYDVTQLFFKGKDPTKKEWNNVHNQTRIVIIQLNDKVIGPRKVQGIAPMPKNVYKVK